MSVQHDQHDLKYWHTWGEFPRECFVIRKFSLPNLSKYSEPLQTFNSDYGTTVSGNNITLFERGNPHHAISKQKHIWKGSKEDFKVAIQGGGDFYELGLYGLQGPISQAEWNARLSVRIADILIKGGTWEPPSWTLVEPPLASIPDHDLFGRPMVMV